MISRILLASTALLCGFAFAAEGGEDRQVQTAAETQRKPEELAPALKSVNFLEGRWQVDQKMTSEYADKGAGDARGRFFIRRDLNGKAMIGHLRASMKEGPYEGHMVLAAAQHGDQPAREGALNMFWADSEGNVSMAKDVQVSGNKLVATFDKHKHGDKMAAVRVTFSKVDDANLSYALEMDHGKGWEKVSTADYSRMPPRERGMDVRHDHKRDHQKETR
jgi:hypothetical protein